MSRFEEDKKRYVLARNGFENKEDLASVDEYSGNVYWTNLPDNASKFDTIDEVKELMEIQNAMNKLLKKDWEYEILEEHRIVSKIQ